MDDVVDSSINSTGYYIISIRHQLNNGITKSKYYENLTNYILVRFFLLLLLGIIVDTH